MVFSCQRNSPKVLRYLVLEPWLLLDGLLPLRRPGGALLQALSEFQITKIPTKVIDEIAFFISLEITRSQVRQGSQEKHLC